MPTGVYERVRRSAIDRALARVTATPSGCWVWEGSVSDRGYGTIGGDGCRSTQRVHKLVYETLIGPVPEGLELHHTCYNRRCCNPAHLETTTHRENTTDEGSSSIPAINARKTHCLRGHEFTPANTYLYRGRRVCKACWRR